MVTPQRENRKATHSCSPRSNNKAQFAGECNGYFVVTPTTTPERQSAHTPDRYSCYSGDKMISDGLLQSSSSSSSSLPTSSPHRQKSSPRLQHGMLFTSMAVIHSS
eukprot:CAMPEP_0203647802 /NCGR_PEP_ID=MMETSP0088-20131115/16825_1 /ASSEMBLY_ACC=CAM_ASM_001087 /TAXON_ID=426623 /ORGANISM="Chaetoceros affinis, Strain CCMP159" /LENGTH=105 /DNA_ID=CAMNT_0050505581 /DNA_START=43 /DNA_END=356 /DNA_ORIENTATION=+